MWQNDRDWQGFSWIDCQDYQQSVLVFKRQGKEEHDFIIAVVNFTPEVRTAYQIGVPEAEYYVEVFNSDNLCYGGSGQVNSGKRQPEVIPRHGQPNSLVITLPPLATVFFKPAGCGTQKKSLASTGSNSLDRVNKPT